MGWLRARSFLLLLVVVGWGAAQAAGRPLDKKLVCLDHATIELPQIYKGKITSSKIPVHLNNGSPLCSCCEKFTNETVTYLSDKQTQDKIVEFLHGACSHTFSMQQKCVELMDYYATHLFAKIAEIKPDEFCKQYGLCRDIEFFYGVRSERSCTFCHHLLNEVISKLKGPDAEFEIIETLLKKCLKIEGHVQQCKRLVLQHIPLILVNGEDFLKTDICALVQACGASRKSVVNPFLDGRLLSGA